MFCTNICTFVRPLPWWLLFNELMNKACHYLLIVTEFSYCYIQVKDNEIVDSGSLKGDCVHYIRWRLYAGQLNSKYNGQFWGNCSVTVIHRVTAIYRTVIYRFDCISFLEQKVRLYIHHQPLCLFDMARV